MKRKIIQLADTTQAITIPREFALNNELKKGDYVNVEIINNSLVIKNNNNIDSKIELNFENLSQDLIWRHLITAYRKGVNIITISYSDKEELSIIQSLVKDLIGMTIIKKGSNKVIVQDIFNKHDINIKEIISRIFALLIEESEEVLNFLNKKDNSITADDINLIDYNINKFTNLILRILNKYGYYDYEKILSLYKTLSLLEEIGDEYRRIANVNSRIKNIKVDKEILSCFNEINLLLKD